MSSKAEIPVQGKEQATAGAGLHAGVESEVSEPQRLEQLCITTIRTLAMDAVQKANSGHPGTPMALAPLAFVLWDCGTIPATHIGRAATASFYPTVTPACCCMPCCT
jgi:hypothetical protein